MTTAGFLKQVSDLKGRASLNDGRLRFRGPGGRVCCPITAVYLAKTGAFLSVEDWEAAAEALGLGYADGWSIALCAEDEIDPARGKDRKLRASLLEAAG